MRYSVAIVLVLISANLFVYSQTLEFDFVDYDDDRYVTSNAHVQDGLTLDGFLWAFTREAESGVGLWHPLTWHSLMLDAQLFGTDPAGYHGTNLLLHILNSLLVFVVFRSMTNGVWRSAFVAALFAVHPLHVESVAFVSERKDVLSTFWGLLSMWAYVGFARRGGAKRYLLCAGLLALGLLAKPMLVTFPLLFLLLDYWPLGRYPEKSVTALAIEKLPLLVLSAAVSIVTYHFEPMFFAVIPVHLRAANAVFSLVRYITKTIWPNDLAVLYPHPYLPGAGGAPLASWEIIGSVAVLLAISALALWANSRRYIIVGWLWYVGTLVPTLGLIQVGVQGLADRYTYVPLLGLFVILAWGGADLISQARQRRELLRSAAAVGAGAMLVVFAVSARSQTRHWRDSVALFEHTLEVTPRNVTMHFNLANVLKRRGEIDRAIDHFRKALEVNPYHAKANINLANTLLEREEVDEAIVHYQRAVEIRPDNIELRRLLGRALLSRGRIDEATQHLRLIVEREPDSAQAHLDLAYALRVKGDLDAAIEHYRRALELEPRSEILRRELEKALHMRESAGQTGAIADDPSEF